MARGLVGKSLGNKTYAWECLGWTPVPESRSVHRQGAMGGKTQGEPNSCPADRGGNIGV